jgi:DNA polymerase V
MRQDKDELLRAVNVGDVWGIGRRYAKMLRNKGINTAYDFTNLDDAWVRKHMSVMGLKTLLELRGTSCLDLGQGHAAKQSICVSRLFGQITKNVHDMQEALAHYVSTAAVKLRVQKSLTTHMMVFAMTNRYHDPHTFFKSTSIQMPLPTAYTPTLIAQAQACLKKIIVPGLQYKKVGVILSDIIPAVSLQLSTYVQEPDIERQHRLMRVVDGVNAKMGKNKLFFAAAGAQQAWKMKQTKKSACFTTNWHELLTIRV